MSFSLFRELDLYQPESFKELGFKKIFADFLDQKKEKAFQRENLEGHFTASSLVLSSDLKKYFCFIIKN